MIRLTPWEEHEETISVSVEQIVYIGRVNEKRPTIIRFDGIEVYVKESPEEVARKVLEYRLAMEDYKHYPDALNARKELQRLAGLDSTNE